MVTSGTDDFMQDLRELASLRESWQHEAGFWRDTPFIWKRWDSYREDWTHDHCMFCFACICNHRDRFPEWKQAHEERGCYRHAYYAEREKGVYIWVCRTCFKRVQAEFGWRTADQISDS
jgi:hypothetical protein